MTIVQAAILGMLLSWTPSAVVLAWLLWRDYLYAKTHRSEWRDD
jgi:hypothetical protein